MYRSLVMLAALAFPTFSSQLSKCDGRRVLAGALRLRDDALNGCVCNLIRIWL